MLIGSLVMDAWGGPKRRVVGVIGFELLSGLCFILMGMEPALWRLALGAFGAHFTIAIIEGSNKSIWQSKIPVEIQGRVFAVWQMISLSMGSTGPAPAPGRWLTGSLSRSMRSVKAPPKNLPVLKRAGRHRPWARSWPDVRADGHGQNHRLDCRLEKPARPRRGTLRLAS